MIRGLLFLSIIGVCVLMGCSLGRVPEDQQVREGLLARQAFAQKYGTIEDEKTTYYFQTIAARLERGLPSYATRSYSVTVLATSTPMAASVGGGYLLISKGMIGLLRNEAELAFVLGHEIAHDIRQNSRDSALGALSPDELQESEMYADKVGLGIMALAGYDPRLGISAIERAYRALGYQTLSIGAGHEVAAESYPPPVARVKAIQQEIAQSGWRPPGTIDRRDFQNLRLSYGLAAYKMH